MGSDSWQTIKDHTLQHNNTYFARAGIFLSRRWLTLGSGGGVSSVMGHVQEKLLARNLDRCEGNTKIFSFELRLIISLILKVF
jgi:hypothetical protein